jgi:hypothetical protein
MIVDIQLENLLATPRHIKQALVLSCALSTESSPWREILSIGNQVIEISSEKLERIGLPFSTIEGGIKPALSKGVPTHFCYQIKANC